jgi:hypothetical protein
LTHQQEGEVDEFVVRQKIRLLLSQMAASVDPKQRKAIEIELVNEKHKLAAYRDFVGPPDIRSPT